MLLLLERRRLCRLLLVLLVLRLHLVPVGHRMRRFVRLLRRRLRGRKPVARRWRLSGSGDLLRQTGVELLLLRPLRNTICLVVISFDFFACLHLWVR